MDDGDLLYTCQCPQRASTYFFQLNSRGDNISSRQCQCPQRASTYFSYGPPSIPTISTSVNALNGLLLISSPNRYLISWVVFRLCQCPQRASTYFFPIMRRQQSRQHMVSMPSTGFYLFLRRHDRICAYRYPVSMPSTGFYLFLRDAFKGTGLYRQVCQCPQRASTYFFYNQKIRYIRIS